MIGIVLVSHSHAAAEGAADLARQIGGADVPLATAGGLDGPDHPIGTDAMRVLAAIEEAWSDDGVLVLMDLGSAVLSAEMALDFLDEDRRSSVRLSDAPFVEGAVAAAVAAKLGRSLDEVEAEARTGLAGKSAHLGVEPSAAAPVPAFSGTEGPTERVRLLVDLPHGLHARPAARLVQTASAFDAHVTVTNVSQGRGPVEARSLNAVATLGVTAGQEIEVAATGPQASQVVGAMRALAERRFDEVDEEEAPPAAETAGPADASELRGIPASPGVAAGPARRITMPSLPPVAPLEGADPASEGDVLDRVLADVRGRIRRRHDQTEATVGTARAAIFDAHLLFLEDDALLGPARAAIDDGRGAAAGWSAAVEDVAERWESLDDPYLRARATDLRSVGREVLAGLMGLPVPRPELSGPGILVASDLEPADAAGLDPSSCLGIATAHGGPTAHAAVLARALGIPAVVGLGERLSEVPDGATLTLDGDRGVVGLAPTPAQLEAIEAARAQRAERRDAARARAAGPAVTRDGTTIPVLANIGVPADASAAVEAGCDGVGLFRTEFLFLERDAMPSEDEQESAYRAVAEALAGRPVVIRTLDVGGDKPLPYLPLPPEANPFLGVRGLRLGLERPAVLDAQLRALVRVAADHPIHVMFPMVTTLEEVRAARHAVDRAREACGVDATPELGIMIEVPAAAIGAAALAAEVGFFSIGTNDLAQYTLAADRGNDRLASIADPLHPSVLRLISATAEAAAAHGIPTAVCGELAGDPRLTPLLLGLGVRELSMSAPAVPLVKDAVRGTDLTTAGGLAKRALASSTADGVRSLLGP